MAAKFPLNLTQLSQSLSLHPSFRDDFKSSLKIIFLMISIVALGLVLFPLPYLNQQIHFLSTHVFLETISIIISVLIFSVGWNAYRHKIPVNIVLLSVLFFGVAILDLVHTITYRELIVDLVTQESEKSSYFGLSARLLAGLGLLYFALILLYSKQVRQHRYFLLISVLLILIIIYGVYFSQDVLVNRIAVYKHNIEIFIMGLNLLTAALLWLSMKKCQSFHVSALFTALMIMAMSEWMFVFYADEDVLFSIMAHLFKSTAYLFIYQAMFVTTVKVPFERLDDSQKELAERNKLLNSIVDNLPNIIFLKDAKNLRYQMFNKAGETLLGCAKSSTLGKKSYKFFSDEQADHFTKNDHESLQSFKMVETPYEEVVTPHGKRILSTKKIAIQDESGQPQYLLGISDDITEQVAKEKALIHSEQTLKTSQRIAGIGNYVFDFRDMSWTASDTLKKIFGIDDDYDQSAKGWFRLIAPEDRAALKKYFKKEVVKRGEQFDYEYRIIRASDSAVRWVNGIGNLKLDEQGNPIQMIGTIQDITSYKKISDSIIKLSLAVEQSPNSIVITDIKGSIEYVNTKFTEVTGYSKEEAIGKNPKILKSGKTHPTIYEDMWETLVRGENWQGELINRRKDRSIYYELVTISPVKQADGQTTNYVAIKQDITEQKRLQSDIENLAHYDQLTNLPNRALLNDRLEYMLGHAKRENENLAIMFLDLDHFKNINDTLGHSIGDKILVETARRLQSATREIDTVSRLGGDEFILVFPKTDAQIATLIVNKLITVISKSSQIDQYELTVTPSIGIAIYPNDGTDLETLLKNADTAMYQVKNESRNSYHFYTQQMNENSARNLELVGALRQALNRNELHVYYQPQHCTETGRIIGSEALLRWIHPELGFISPAEFIPIAEESGLIIEIGEWVLRTAIVQLKEWNKTAQTDFVMAINISAVQFRQINFAEQISRIIDEEGVSHHNVELELTEAIAMHDPQYVVNVMDNFHEKGIRMAIDDFGTGYSSLSYLKQFNAHKLKIDQSFVRDIEHSSDDRAIVSTIIDMANNLGMRTIAEGVETKEQLAFLSLHGCHEIQGYYYSKPIPEAEFSDYMQSFDASLTVE